MTLVDRVRETIEREGLLSGGDTVIVAVSGGADSVALVHLLASLRDEWHLTLHVAHLNHALRPDAADDARFVQDVADRLGMPATIETVDVAAFALREHRSVEDAGRAARYAFFSALASRLGASRVATAHTRDDQVETVLMRLMQGGSWEMLAGIPSLRPLGQTVVVRPLRTVSREEIRRYLRDRHSPYHDDPTNRDRRILRNRIRLEVLPALPQGTADLCWALGELARDTNMVLRRLTAMFYGHFPVRGGRAIRFPRESFRALPEPLRRRLLRLAIAEIAGTPQTLPVVVERRIVRAAQAAPTGQETAAGPAVLRIGYDGVEVAPLEPDTGPAAYRLAVPGETTAEDFGMVFTAEVVEGAPVPRARGPHEVIFDAACAGTELVIRAWRPGDRFLPQGGRGKKKVADFFIDAKVPRWNRRRVPLLVDAQDRVLWVVGYRASEDCRVSERMHSVLRVRARPA